MSFSVESVFYYLLLIPVISSLLGYFIVKQKKTGISWLLFIITTVVIERATFNANPLFRMLAIIIAMFVGMKVIAATERYKSAGKQLTLFQWMLFVSGWFGMRSELFETVGHKPVEGYKDMLFTGFSRVIIGSGLIYFAHKLLQLNYPAFIPVISILAMIGLSLILHFGVLAMSAGAWRLFGVRTYYLFKSPLKSTSLNEFWGKRWNIAFSEMTSITVFRPLKKIAGAKTAFVAAFLFSGLLHEMAISLPVNKGFGLPLLYFVIQAVVMMLEEFLSTKNITFFKEGYMAKLWVYFWIIAPAPILFHTHFVKEIIWPLAGLHFP